MMLFMSSFCWLAIQVPPECSVSKASTFGYWLWIVVCSADVAAVAVPGDAAEERVVADRGVVDAGRAVAVVGVPVPVQRQHLGGQPGGVQRGQQVGVGEEVEPGAVPLHRRVAAAAGRARSARDVVDRARPAPGRPGCTSRSTGRTRRSTATAASPGSYAPLSFIQAGALHGVPITLRFGLSCLGLLGERQRRRPGRGRWRSAPGSGRSARRACRRTCSWSGPGPRRPSGCAGSPGRSRESGSNSFCMTEVRVLDAERAAAVHQPGGGVGERRAGAGELLVLGVLVDVDRLAGARRCRRRRRRASAAAGRGSRCGRRSRWWWSARC